MSAAVHTGDTRGIGHADLHAPRQLLALCLAASLALHALALLLLPDWNRNTAVPLIPVLDVVLVPRAPEALTAVRYEPPPEMPKKAYSQPRRAMREPPRVMASAPVALAQPVQSALQAMALPAEPQQSASEPPFASTPAPIRAEAASTPPLFTAAYLRNPPPRYPLAARRNGDEGQVMLKVLVSAEGAPVRVELDQSSGSSLLDGAALEAVHGWRFVPARRGVQNVDGWVRVPLVFRLES